MLVDRMDARTDSADVARRETPEWLALECYTEGESLAGVIRWPIGLRLLDLLNSLYTTQQDSSGEFLDFVDISRETDSAHLYISKAAVHMVTVSESDLARGAGAAPERRFPFVKKSEVPVSIKLRSHTIEGTMHVGDNETVDDVLNRDALFVPVTNATLVTSDNHFYGTRPFVAVNKRHIIWVRIERPPR